MLTKIFLYDKIKISYICDKYIRNLFKIETLKRGENMKNLSIVIEDDLHYQIKINALMQNQSIKQYLLSLIEKDLKQKNRTNGAKV